VFTDFTGTVESTGEPGGVRASGTVEVASVDTRSERRNQHLRGAEFFDMENHPQITFESMSIGPDDERAARGRQPDHQGHHA
jgi:polyisoprenoid-binding protein YceI